MAHQVIASLGFSHMLLLACLTSIIFSSVQSQNEVCHLNNLRADCLYHVDPHQLSQIIAVIDPCADPVDVTFTISSEYGKSPDFKHTFKSSDNLVTVTPFRTLVLLRVRLTMKGKDLMNVEADFKVKGATRDFLNSDVDLKGQIDICPNLNAAAKIAIGVMCGLAAIVLVVIGVLVYESYKHQPQQQL